MNDVFLFMKGKTCCERVFFMCDKINFFMKFVTVLLLLFFSCKNNCNSVHGILIWKENLIVADENGFSYCELVEKALLNDDDAISKLLSDKLGFGAASAYGNADVIVHIIDRLGQDKFITHIEKLPDFELKSVKGSISAGLEYSSDTKFVEKKISEIFPTINKFFNDRRIK